MNKIHLDDLIARMESYLECWKQYNAFMNLARSKKFGDEDESQFLEIKSILTQELELILSRVDCGPVSRDDVHSLLAAGPSVRFLSEMNEGSLRNLENQWHKIFIGWQCILGQLKVKQQQMDNKSGMGGWFGRKKAA